MSGWDDYKLQTDDETGELRWVVSPFTVTWRSIVTGWKVGGHECRCVCGEDLHTEFGTFHDATLKLGHHLGSLNFQQAQEHFMAAMMII